MKTTPFMALIYLMIAMTSLPVFAQKKAAKSQLKLTQGNCAWAMTHAVSPMNLSPHYRCWYGTSENEKISTTGGTVVITFNHKSETLGKVTTTRNLIYTYEGNDQIYGSGEDWIYPGEGTNEIFITGKEFVILSDGSQNRIYLCNNDQKKHIINAQPNDSIVVNPSAAHCPSQPTAASNQAYLVKDNSTGDRDCPCGNYKMIYIDGEGILNDREEIRCDCPPAIGSDDWVRSQGWDPMRH